MFEDLPRKSEEVLDFSILGIGGEYTPQAGRRADLNNKRDSLFSTDKRLPSYQIIHLHNVFTMKFFYQ